MSQPVPTSAPPPRLAVTTPDNPPASAWIGPARWAVLGIVAAFMLLFLWGGTAESRVLYPVLLLIGILNPVWALYALALYGGLFLFDISNTHVLAGLEVLVLGAVAGEARLWNRPGREALAMAPGPRADGTADPGDRVPWNPGLWPAWCVALLCLLAGSAVMGLRLVLQREDEVLARPDRLLATLMNIYYGPATGPEWGLRSLHNWSFGMLLGAIAARRATALRAARWLKFGGIGLVVICVLALLDRAGLIPLSSFRRPNPDPLHAGRLQGIAGHAGWFGQWIVLFLPGVALWWVGGGGRRRRIAVVVALGTVALALLLTGARAPWLGAGAVAAVLGGWLALHRPEHRRMLLIGAVIALLAAATAQVAFGLMDRVVEQRLTHVLRITDRARYYASSLELLCEHPLGIGLGTHWLTYSDRFPPWYRFYQPDHVDSHSLYLHTLVENGPVALALLLLGFGMLARDFRRAWPALGVDARRTCLALGAAMAGMLVVGFAQYLPYIRPVELSLWVLGGLLVGVLRREAPGRFLAPPHPRSAPLLVALGAAAGLLAAGWHLQRPLVGQYPRDHYRWDAEANGYTFWTGARWRMPVHPNVRSLRFQLLHGPEAGAVTITWPDGSRERIPFAAGESRPFRHEVPPVAAHALAPPRWLIIEVERPFIPARRDPSSRDHRTLGVYVIGLDAETVR